MDNNFEKFNSLFPNSQYRRIKPGEKAPLNAMIVSYKDVMNDTERVGWVISQGYIVVDIDDKTTAKKLESWITDCNIHCVKFYTEHGMHFIFKAGARVIKNSAKVSTYLGIEVDYRVAGKGYIVLPFNDSTRSWNELPNTAAVLDTLPDVLCPVMARPEADFVNLGEGSRNDALYQWSVKLRSMQGTSEMKIEALKIINKYFFEEPLSDDELSHTVLRDEQRAKIRTFEVAPTNDKKPLAEKENECVDAIMDNLTFKCMNQDILYVYNGAYYRYISERELEVIIAKGDYYPDSQLFRDASRKEVISKIKLFASQVDKDDDKYWSYLSFNNCVVDITTGQTYEPSPAFFITTHINRNYVEDAPVSDGINAFIDHCSSKDAQKRQLILEMIGDCFLRRAIFQKMYLIYGEGGTGKSTLLRLITNAVGHENAAYLSTKDLENMFYPAELFGKLVNIGDDIPFTKITDSSQIKKLVSGEAMMIQRKFQHPTYFNNYATLIFTTNQLPNTNDRTSGFMRRLAIIDMNVRVTDPTAFFAESFSDRDYEYLICIAVEAIKEALKRGSLTRSFVVERNLEAYQKMNSSLAEFIDDNNITKEYLVGRSTSEVYAEYTHHCQENGIKYPLGKHTVMAEFMKMFYLMTAKTTDELGNVATRFVYVTNTTN